MKCFFTLLLVCSISASAYADIPTTTYLYGQIPLEMVEVLILGSVTFSVILLRFLKKKKQSEKQERQIKILNSIMLFGITLVYVVLALVIALLIEYIGPFLPFFIAIILFMFICFGIPILKLMQKLKQYLKGEIALCCFYCVYCVYFILVIMLIFVVSVSLTDGLLGFNHLIEGYVPYSYSDERLLN
ncbi:MAG: hypothetical protein IKV03_05540 [Alphaproteobacteria bacterium]|nr:hypothetical protein [Alphaproteobacteria bacterium]